MNLQCIDFYHIMVILLTSSEILQTWCPSYKQYHQTASGTLTIRVRGISYMFLRCWQYQFIVFCMLDIVLSGFRDSCYMFVTHWGWCMTNNDCIGNITKSISIPRIGVGELCIETHANIMHPERFSSLLCLYQLQHPFLLWLLQVLWVAEPLDWILSQITSIFMFVP